MGKKVWNNNKNVRGKKLTMLPEINSFQSRREWELSSWHKILESKELLSLLVTSYERHNLIMRAATLERLASGKSYKQISEELWLSPQTISTIKKSISEKGYKSYLERSKRERRKKQYSEKPRANRKRTPSGRPVRTKYGTIYMPY